MTVYFAFFKKKNPRTRRCFSSPQTASVKTTLRFKTQKRDTFDWLFTLTGYASQPIRTTVHFRDFVFIPDAYFFFLKSYFFIRHFIHLKYYNLISHNFFVKLVEKCYLVSCTFLCKGVVTLRACFPLLFKFARRPSCWLGTVKHGI